MNTNDNVITIQPINYDLTSEHTNVVSMINDIELISYDIDPSEVQYDLADDESIQKQFDLIRERIEHIYKEHQRKVLVEIEKSKKLLDAEFPKDYLEKSLQKLLKKLSFKGETITQGFDFSLSDLTTSSPMAKLLRKQSKYLKGMSNISLKKFHLLVHDWADKIIHHFQKTVELFCQKSNGFITFKSFKSQKKGSLFNLDLMKDKVHYHKPAASLVSKYTEVCACFWYTNSCCSGFNTIRRNCCWSLLQTCNDFGCCDHSPSIKFNPSKSDEYTRFPETSMISFTDCCPIVHKNEIANPLDNNQSIEIYIELELEPIEAPSITWKDLDSVSLYSVSSLPEYDQVFANIPSYASLQPESEKKSNV